MFVRSWFIALPAAVMVLGCDGAGGGDSETGQATLAIEQVPEDVGCVAITAIGAHRIDRKFDVVPGASANLDLHGLSLGEVTFRADAFDGACAAVALDAIPTWVSDDETVTIESGEVAEVMLTMRRSGKADVTLDFAEGETCDPQGSTCASNDTCCSGVCASGTCGGVTCVDVREAIDAGAYPDNTPLNEAFASEGVHLSFVSSMIAGTVTNSTPPGEPTYFIQRFSDGGLDGTWTDNPSFDRVLRIEFDEPTDSVAIDAYEGNYFGFGSDPSVGVLEAYDASGNLVATASAALLESFEGTTTLAVLRTEGDIARVIAYGTGEDYDAGAMLANLQYDRAVCGP